MTIGNRTVLAQQALDASDVIHMTFARRWVGTSPPRKLSVQVPDGPSTEGGKKARQSITLAPEEAEGAAVMCGWLDVSRQQAEIRSYEAVAAQYEGRFRRHFDVTLEEYRDLMQDLDRTLRNLGVTTRFGQATSSIPGRPPGELSRGHGRVPKRLWWAVAALLALSLAAAFVLT